MREIPLYADIPLAALEQEQPLRACPDCKRCSLHEGVRSVCMQAAGDPGGALLIGDYPGAVEDRLGIPFTGQTGRYLQRFVTKIWDKPIAVDNAVRCCPGARSVNEKQVAACRGYAAATLREVKPKRVVAMGGKAVLGVLGRAVPLMSARRGYGWLYNGNIDSSETPIPVFQVFNPVTALRNRFMRKMFEADLTWALTCNIPEPPPWEENCFVIETREDAEFACQALRAADWFSYDCETAGIQYKDDFMVVALAACAKGSTDVYVWDRRALYNTQTSDALYDILCDKLVAKMGQNLKFDSHAVDCAFGIVLENYYGDVRLWRRLLAADVDASLDVIAELVGLGGIKHEAEVALAKAGRALAKSRREYAKDPDGQSVILSTENPILLNACRNPDESAKVYTYGLIDNTVMLRYCARDAMTTTRAGELLEDRLERDEPIKRVWDEIVKDSNRAIKTIEGWGIPTSAERTAMYQAHLKRKMDAVQARFDTYGDFKPNSPKSVGDLLYGKLGLHPPKQTNTGNPSTDHESLKALRGQHSVVDDLLEWRRLGKLYGFATGIERHICPDGRIHPSIKIDGTRTGRLSCIAEGTPIEVIRDVSRYPNGVPIEQVRSGDYVYTFGGDNRLTIRKVLRVLKNGRRALVRLHWRGQGGYSKGFVDLTPDHRVRLFDGTYCRVDALKSGDRVCALSRGLNAYGYARLWATHEKEIREHKFVYQHFFSDCPEHIHHVDGNKLNNVAPNLVGKSAVDHLSEHGRNPSDALRQHRSARMRQQHVAGIMPKVPNGAKNWSWKDLTVTEATLLLESNKWSITLAAKAGNWDFATFRSKLVSLGFDCDEIKRKSRAVRWESILQAAAIARAARCGNNHVVVRVEDLGVDGEVYDLEIEDTHNFIAGGIAVHNCHEPNLQNISRPKDEDAKYARDLFVALDDWELLEVDYSQLELRVATMLCQDPKMLEIWKSGVDYHRRTAESIAGVAWGIKPDQVTSEHRSSAKTVNFGIIYGMTVPSLAKRIGCSVSLADKIYKSVTGEFRVFSKWCKQQIENARRTGHVWTWWAGQRARRRPLWSIADHDEKRRSNAENGAVNTPVQGTASDFCLASISVLIDWLLGSGLPAELVLTVHDSVMFHARSDVIDEVGSNAQRIMTQWDSAGVPLVVDMKRGKSWGSLEDYKIAA